jgi:hypothetical protein
MPCYAGPARRGVRAGLRSATGNRVPAERWVAGSNPALSASSPASEGSGKQAASACDCNCLAARMGVELSEQACHVDVDRLRAEKQVSGDLPVREAVCQESEHVALAPCRLVSVRLSTAGRVRRDARPACEILAESYDDARANFRRLRDLSPEGWTPELLERIDRACDDNGQLSAQWAFGDTSVADEARRLVEKIRKKQSRP